MNSILSKRAVALAKHIVQTGQTVRQTASVFGISKSTVHNDVSNRLKNINFALFCKVQIVLKKNFSEKHIRGGQTTKNKFLLCKKNEKKS